jgi:hypothetical protein
MAKAQDQRATKAGVAAGSDKVGASGGSTKVSRKKLAYNEAADALIHAYGEFQQGNVEMGLRIVAHVLRHDFDGMPLLAMALAKMNQTALIQAEGEEDETPAPQPDEDQDGSLSLGEGEDDGDDDEDDVSEQELASIEAMVKTITAEVLAEDGEARQVSDEGEDAGMLFDDGTEGTTAKAVKKDAATAEGEEDTDGDDGSLDEDFEEQGDDEVDQPTAKMKPVKASVKNQLRASKLSSSAKKRLVGKPQRLLALANIASLDGSDSSREIGLNLLQK